MTTQQLPPLPEQVLPCPFCGGKPHRHYERGADGVGGYLSMMCGDCGAMSTQNLIYEPCHMTELEIKQQWNRRAALSTRPVAESIHAENAKTLQALVDELREMLGVKEGESLTASVRFLQEDRRSIDTAPARMARDYYGDQA